MSDLVLNAEKVSKSYQAGNRKLKVLDDVDFKLYSGEKIGLLGASGSGKSTLLNILGGLDLPDQGHVYMSDKRFSDFNESQLCRWRNESLGFVYQFHHLLPEFSAEENVAIPLVIKGFKMIEAIKEAQTILSSVNLSSRIKHYPNQLSGGERQRVAIARALVCKPMCILMDEPTGNLDINASEQILDLISDLSYIHTAFVLATHSSDVARRMDKTFELHDGSLRVLSQ